jgi:WD40 repeat protein
MVTAIPSSFFFYVSSFHWFLMRRSHDDLWMVTADDGGISINNAILPLIFGCLSCCLFNDVIGVVKYWQSSMNNVKAFKAHKESVRDITFAPSDMKFASCSDDKSISVWDFESGKEEVGMNGHGWDVKSVHWHPQKSLLLSGDPRHVLLLLWQLCCSLSCSIIGSKDHFVKLWDPKTGNCFTTIHGHKNTVTKVRWSPNGQWFLSYVPRRLYLDSCQQ